MCVGGRLAADEEIQCTTGANAQVVDFVFSATNKCVKNYAQVRKTLRITCTCIKEAPPRTELRGCERNYAPANQT